VLIIYSVSFRDEILSRCSKYKNLRIIDFNSLELSQNTNNLFNDFSLLSQFNCLEGGKIQLTPITAPIFKPNIPPYYGLESEFNSVYDYWLEFRRDIFKAFTRNIHYIYQSTRAGDIAEFGTCSGGTASIIAASMQQATFSKGIRNQRKLHLFDSFNGLPKISNKLDQIAGWKEGEYKYLNRDQLAEVISRYLSSNEFLIYEGWFSDTLSSINKNTKFIMINIDCDTYESTYQVLDYLFKNSHILNGCSIFFDDWNCSNSSPFLGEQLAWNQIIKKYNIQYTDCGEYSALGRKFIVHDNTYEDLVFENSL